MLRLRPRGAHPNYCGKRRIRCGHIAENAHPSINTGHRNLYKLAAPYLSRGGIWTPHPNCLKPVEEMSMGDEPGIVNILFWHLRFG